MKQDTVHTDDIIYQPYLWTQSNLLLLRESGIITNAHSWPHVFRLLYRLILNPSHRVIQTVLKEKQTFLSKNILGVHIRTAGLLCDVPEIAEMISPEMVISLPTVIQTYISKSAFDMSKYVIFLSTDSIIVESYILSTLGKNYSIILPQNGKRGHSNTFPTREVLFRSISDLFMMAQSSYLLFGLTSSFGKLMYYLSNSSGYGCIPQHQRYVIIDTSYIKYCCFL